jgi:hypothetical protein
MFALDDGIWSGNLDLADVLLLIAVVLFAVAGVIAALARPDPARGSLVPFGLALTALALLVW